MLVWAEEWYGPSMISSCPAVSQCMSTKAAKSKAKNLRICFMVFSFGRGGKMRRLEGVTNFSNSGYT